MLHTEVDSREMLVVLKDGSHDHYLIPAANVALVIDLFTSTKRDDRFIRFDVISGTIVILNTDRIEEVRFMSDEDSDFLHGSDDDEDKED